MTAPSRKSASYQQFLQKVQGANPIGEIMIVTDDLSSHNSLSTRTWLEEHPLIRHVFIHVGACWLNLREGWWRIFRKAALPGPSFAGPGEIDQTTRLATDQLNSRANPGYGADPPHQPANYDASMCTPIEEVSNLALVPG
ncbi:hypothetical protein SAMN05216268_1564 [Streptomyces yunnanensis]|uniref:DDE superfamily endonuclease n=2 Tax=Streptomyces yunnanensis TaxID=156453 RepID=A0A9X8N9S0_9ACTN|nr:hypothetical protein SAMN05216268_1564 [Streptomyces yunnanensis]